MSFWDKELRKEIGGVGCDVQMMDFSYLIGSTIQNVGFHPESGGFAIDFLRDGDERRVVLGFNELGMWKEWEGRRGKPSSLDLLLKKISKITEAKSWVDIIDDPKCRSYHFMDGGEKELFELNLKEIKSLPEEMRKPFSIRDKEERDNAVLMALNIGIP